MRNTLIIIIVICITVILSYKFYLKRNPMTAFLEAMKAARKKYPKFICDNAERIFRLETAHFKSGQFTGTLSPGMEKFSDTYPYGWKTLKKYVWDKNPEYKPIGLKTYGENGTGKQKTFIVFPSLEASLLTLCEFLTQFNNNPGRWFSLNSELQESYNKKIAGIKAKISDAIA